MISQAHYFSCNITLKLKGTDMTENWKWNIIIIHIITDVSLLII